MNESKKDTTAKAQQEFKNMVDNLRKHGIKVTIYKQQKDDLPDSVFPNNWFSTHRDPNIPNGAFITYPMKHPSR